MDTGLDPNTVDVDLAEPSSHGDHGLLGTRRDEVPKVLLATAADSCREAPTCNELRSSIILLTIALSAVSVSCGDDVPPLGRAEFVERSNARCTESNETIGRIVGSVFGAGFWGSHDNLWASANAMAADLGLDACGT